MPVASAASPHPEGVHGRIIYITALYKLTSLCEPMLSLAERHPLYQSTIWCNLATRKIMGQGMTMASELALIYKT